MNTPAVTPYQARLQRVLAYIEDHLGDDLNGELLSGIAAFSKFHFHRQFAAFFELGVGRYIQLARLKRASYRLAFRQDPVIEIALECGYESPEAFARAFKQHMGGQTPSDFRAQPQWDSWQETFQRLGEIRATHMKINWQTSDVKIVETTDTRVAVLEHHGDPALLGNTIRRFIAWRKSASLSPKTSATFNILYEDPETIAPADFRLDICVATNREIGPNDDGITARTISGGRCAVLRHIGPDDTFADAARYLYGVWLPASGEELRDFPPYCRRVTFFPDVPENEAVTDLYLPLKEKAGA